MKHLHQNILWGAAAALLLTGCIDNNYDLSDIDTTSEFKVNDLTLPLNLDPVVLSDIIKVKEGDQLNIYTIDGNTFYGVLQDGSFSSEGVDIKAVTSSPDPMNQTTATFRLSGQMDARRRADGDSQKIYFLLNEVHQDLEYHDENVDGAVRDITKLNFNPLSFMMKLKLNEKLSGVSSSLEEIKINLPEGLSVVSVNAPGYTFHASDYDFAHGILTLDYVDVKDGETTIEIVSDAIELDIEAYKDNKPFIYNPTTGKGSFNLNSQFTINQGGNLVFSASPETLATLPEELTFTVDYVIGTLEATSLMGSIQYDLDGVDIKPVDLSNLPDFLDEEGTDLALSNPMIFLQLQNPVSKYGLKYQAYLDIVPMRDGHASNNFMSPLITAPADANGNINIMLAANVNGTVFIPDDYKENLERQTYTDLGDILSGNGLPDELRINVENAEIPLQSLSSPLELGDDTGIDGMEGSYMFLAPLALKDGSTIVKTVDGWWSEDLSDLTIDYLTINANATNGLPTGVILNIYAIDKDGKQVSTTGSLELAENASNTPIEVKLNGPITNLDGIQLYVIAANNNDKPLAPTQFITLDNIKAKVTGNYTRKL